MHPANHHHHQPPTFHDLLNCDISATFANAGLKDLFLSNPSSTGANVNHGGNFADGNMSGLSGSNEAARHQQQQQQFGTGAPGPLSIVTDINHIGVYPTIQSAYPVLESTPTPAPTPALTPTSQTPTSATPSLLTPDSSPMPQPHCQSPSSADLPTSSAGTLSSSMPAAFSRRNLFNSTLPPMRLEIPTGILSPAPRSAPITISYTKPFGNDRMAVGGRPLSPPPTPVASDLLAGDLQLHHLQIQHLHQQQQLQQQQQQKQQEAAAPAKERRAAPRRRNTTKAKVQNQQQQQQSSQQGQAGSDGSAEFSPSSPNASNAESKDTETTENKKPFTCPHPGCERSFPRYYNLKSHMLCHSDQRPHVCTACKASFARKHDLQRHIRTLHASNRPFKCPKCQQGFRRATSFWRHMLEEQQQEALAAQAAQAAQAPNPDLRTQDASIVSPGAATITHDGTILKTEPSVAGNPMAFQFQQHPQHHQQQYHSIDGADGIPTQHSFHHHEQHHQQTQPPGAYATYAHYSSSSPQLGGNLLPGLPTEEPLPVSQHQSSSPSAYALSS
ncbi:Metallothionein expression activator [Quaeritorhiza haematococci]|nr:Metallothionein expression activator [Quaeritorhiza haematococci]